MPEKKLIVKVVQTNRTRADLYRSSVSRTGLLITDDDLLHGDAMSVCKKAPTRGHSCELRPTLLP
jgi:hypothetical protein